MKQEEYKGSSTDLILERPMTQLLNDFGADKASRGLGSAAMSGVMSSIFIINLNLKTLKRRNYASDNLKRVEELQSKLERLQARAFHALLPLAQRGLNQSS